MSIEAEFTFTRAIGGYSRKAILEGTFKGNMVGNVREQLLRRAAVEEKGKTKKYMLLIGGSQSQISRMGVEVEKIGGEVEMGCGKHRE